MSLKHKSGVRVTAKEKVIVHNVRQFFEKEKHEQRSIRRNEVITRTAMATGIGTTTVKMIKKEYYVEHGDFDSTAGKRYKKERFRVYPDDFDREAIRRTVHDFYLNKTYPTLDKLLHVLKDKGIFKGGRTTLSKVLRSMGFKYKVREDGKRYVYEQPRVIQQRHDFLRRMRKNRLEARPEVYLDETWANSHAARKDLGG